MRPPRGPILAASGRLSLRKVSARESSIRLYVDDSSRAKGYEVDRGSIVGDTLVLGDMDDDGVLFRYLRQGASVRGLKR